VRQGAGRGTLHQEHDALPALGNAAEPRQTPARSGSVDGHGCGHNMPGAGCTGGAIALRTMLERAGTPGTVRVYGCASEEAQGAKVHFVRDGLFDDVDLALAWHPAPVAALGELMTAANVVVKVRFAGRTAHAGNTPRDGRSAPKGAELFGAGLQFMREHLLPTTRMHYVYEQAGVAPNIVPEMAQIWLTLRAESVEEVQRVVAWARDVARGAGLMTQTEAAFDLHYGMQDILPNTPSILLQTRHASGRTPRLRGSSQVRSRSAGAIAYMAGRRTRPAPSASRRGATWPVVPMRTAPPSSVHRKTPVGPDPGHQRA